MRRWAGKTASLQIVDQEQGGWGNVGVDDIVFTDRPLVPLGPLAAEKDFGTMGLGLLESEARGARSAWPLAWAGWGIALYHCLIFWGVVSEGLVPCGQGTSCADADVQVAGGVPIPLLSWIAFTGILAFLWSAIRRIKP